MCAASRHGLNSLAEPAPHFFTINYYFILDFHLIIMLFDMQMGLLHKEEIQCSSPFPDEKQKHEISPA